MSNRKQDSQSGSNRLDDFFNSAWNLLKSMKFAIILLIVLAVVSIINLFSTEFIVQVHGSPAKIRESYVSMYGEFRTAMLMFFQMYSPYRSWWYTLLLGALTLSQTICVIDRAPTVFRLVFRPQFIRDPKLYATIKPHDDLTGDKGAGDRLMTTLRQCGFKVWHDENGALQWIDAEKHAWSRSGSWFVHIGFILLIVGGAMIARGEYRMKVSGLPGEMLMSNENEWGFNVRVDDFTIEYYPLGAGQLVEVDGKIIGKIVKENPGGNFNIETYRPQRGILSNIKPERISNRIETYMGGGRLDQANIADYIAMLTVIENGVEIETRRVEVNAPLRYKGYRFYQSSFDDSRIDAQGRWTTIIEVRKDTGSPFVWVGIVVFSIGLVIGMYVTPRQVFAMIEKEGEKERILLAGRTVKNGSLFEKEFDRIVRSIRQSIQVKSRVE